MKTTIFRGVATALITPMNKDFTINYSVLEQLLDYQLTHKADAILIGGTTGESAALSDKELFELTDFTIRAVRKRVPVIASMGSNNTAHSVELAKKMEQLGADALLSVTPYYNKTSQEGLYQHFLTGAKATGLPIILYNVPSRTGMNIAPQTFGRLAKIGNITAVKEASGNFSQIAQIAAQCGDALDIYSGNDDQIVPALSLGAKGVISVLSNLLPQVTHNICQSYFDGDTDTSRKLQLQYLELIQGLFMDVNPIPVKQAMNALNLKAGPCRSPLCPLSELNTAKLLRTLNHYGLTTAPQKGLHPKHKLSLISSVF